MPSEQFPPQENQIEFIRSFTGITKFPLTPSIETTKFASLKINNSMADYLSDSDTVQEPQPKKFKSEKNMGGKVVYGYKGLNDHIAATKGAPASPFGLAYNISLQIPTFDYSGYVEVEIYLPIRCYDLVDGGIVNDKITDSAHNQILQRINEFLMSASDKPLGITFYTPSSGFWVTSPEPYSMICSKLAMSSGNIVILSSPRLPGDGLSLKNSQLEFAHIVEYMLQKLHKDKGIEIYDNVSVNQKHINFNALSLAGCSAGGCLAANYCLRNLHENGKLQLKDSNEYRFVSLYLISPVLIVTNKGIQNFCVDNGGPILSTDFMLRCIFNIPDDGPVRNQLSPMLIDKSHYSNLPQFIRFFIGSKDLLLPQTNEWYKNLSNSLSNADARCSKHVITDSGHEILWANTKKVISTIGDTIKQDQSSCTSTNSPKLKPY